MIFGMMQWLNGSQIMLGNNHTMIPTYYVEKLTVKMHGDDSYLDLTQSRITGILTIDIAGDDNTVFINHPNKLYLTVTGRNSYVGNRSSTSQDSQIQVVGEGSTYKTNVGYISYLFGPYMTLIKNFAIVVLAGIVLYKALPLLASNRSVSIRI